MTLTGVVNAWESPGVPHTTLADGRIASRFFIVKRAAREEKRAAAHKTGVSHGFHSAVHTQQIRFRRRSDAPHGRDPVRLRNAGLAAFRSDKDAAY